MSNFSIIFPDEVINYQQFFWSTKWDDYRRFLVKLVGFKISDQGIQSVYLSVFSLKLQNNNFIFEIQFSRRARFVINISKRGIQRRWFDVRKG